MHVSKLIAAAVVSLLVMAACGGPGGTPATTPTATTAGGGTTAPSGGTADPCTLLTQADIKTATGKDWGVSVADVYGKCRWYAGTSTVDQGKGMVAVSFDSTGTTLDSVKSGPSAGGVDITVSGHPAYSSGGEFNGIWVDVGTSLLVITLSPLPVGGQAMLEHLAEVALGKM